MRYEAVVRWPWISPCELCGELHQVATMREALVELDPIEPTYARVCVVCFYALLRAASAEDRARPPSDVA